MACTHLHRFHVQHFCDTALHDQEVWVVHVHLDGTEQIDDAFVEHRAAIDEVLVFTTAADTYLTRHCDLFAVFIANWAIGWVGVIEYNCDRCFGDTGLTIFED